MKYFKFEIPEGLGYSPDWHGTLSKCPNKVEVLLYNEQDGYGIAYTPDEKLPKGITRVEEAEALGTMTDVAFRKTQEKLYYGYKLYDKWTPEPELAEEISDTIAELLEVSDGR
jgi:hypothetical protein